MGDPKRKLSPEAALNTVLGRINSGHLKSPFLLYASADLKVQVVFSGSFPTIFLRATSRCLISEGDMHLKVI